MVNGDPVSDLKVMHTPAGYYIGRTYFDLECGTDFPYSRESGYMTEADAQAALASGNFAVRDCIENNALYELGGLPHPHDVLHEQQFDGYTITVASKRTGATGEYIGRPSPLGNPFRVKPHGQYERGETIELYRRWLWDKISTGDRDVCIELDRLTYMARHGDLTLLCWCAPKACHGDVIKKCIEWRLEG